MDYFERFAYTAIMLIYPNGYVDWLPIDSDDYHPKYFNKLLKKSSSFSEIVMGSCFIDDDGVLVNTTDPAYDKFLTDLGIIIVRNISIPDIKRIDDFLKFNYPVYIYSVPKIFSKEQKEILEHIFHRYDCKDSMYIHNKGDELEDFTYDQVAYMIKDEKLIR